MNLDDCTKVRMVDLGEHAYYVITKVCPDLHDFALYHHNGEFISIDFFFKDDPRKDEEGYCGEGIEEFIPDSDTYNRLVTVTDIAFYCLGLKEEEVK